MADSKCNGCADNEFYWRDYSRYRIPCKAFKVPDFFDCKYIGQVNYSKDVCLPVCIYPQENKAVGEWKGKREFSRNIRILCTNNSDKFYWEQIDFTCFTDCQMKNAIVGGYQDDYDLYIGKAYDEGEWKIGKVVPGYKPYAGLHIWNSCGYCLLYSIFDILKCPSCS